MRSPRSIGVLASRAVRLAVAGALAVFVAGAGASLRPASAAEARELTSPIVQLGSRYADERGGTATEIGSGVLVDREGLRGATQFVLTDAHLIGGDRPWVLVDGRRGEARVVSADAVDDVALLEIPRTPIPAAYTYSSERGIQPYDDLLPRLRCLTGQGGAACPAIRAGHRLKKIDFSTGPSGAGAAGATDPAPRGVFLSPEWASPGSEEGRLPPGLPAWKDDPRWVFTTEDSYLQRNEDYFSRNRPYNTFDGHHFVVPALTSGGNSGTIAVDEGFRGRFLGMPVQYSYFSRHAKVAGPELFHRLFEVAPAASGAGAKPAPRWRLRGGLLYLDFGDGVIDIDSTRSPSGRGVADSPGGVSAPPGGVSAPPGGASAPPGGVSAPPGGVSAPPGDCAHPVPGRPADAALESTGAVSLAASEILLGKAKGMDPAEVFRRHGITPYMSRNGIALRGFAVRGTDGFRATIYPNAEGYQWVRTRAASEGFEATPITEEPDFTRLLEEKLRAQLGGPGTVVRYPVEGRPFVLTRDALTTHPPGTRMANGCWRITSVEVSIPGMPPGSRLPLDQPIIHCDGSAGGASDDERRQAAISRHGVASLDVTDDGNGARAIRLRWKFLDGVKAASASGTRCELDRGDYRVSDELEVTLDSRGRLPGRDAFQPIVKVASRGGEEFYLDLRPLFFTDLSVTYPGDIYADWSARRGGLREFAGHAGLELAPIRGDAERTVQFNARSAPRDDGKLSCESFEK